MLNTINKIASFKTRPLKLFYQRRGKITKNSIFCSLVAKLLREVKISYYCIAVAAADVAVLIVDANKADFADVVVAATAIKLL